MRNKRQFEQDSRLLGLDFTTGREAENRWLTIPKSKAIRDRLKLAEGATWHGQQRKLAGETEQDRRSNSRLNWIRFMHRKHKASKAKSGGRM